MALFNFTPIAIYFPQPIFMSINIRANCSIVDFSNSFNKSFHLSDLANPNIQTAMANDNRVQAITLARLTDRKE